MRAECIKYYEFGKPEDVLKVEHKHIKAPKNGEIIVRMTARPINPSDLIPIQGAYSNRITLPAVPGYEGVGIVEAVGPSVSQTLIGRRVLPLRGEGTWQEYVKTNANLAVTIPDTIDDDIASQLYINPLTAWIVSKEILKLQPDDVLLVNACGSSIGRIFAQLSKLFGFRLIAVTRDHTYTEELLRLGASHVINTAVTSLHHTVMELTNGMGAQAAIDSVGGMEGTELAFCVQPKGIFLMLGLLSGKSVNWKKISESIDVTIRMFHLRHWNQQVSILDWQETFNLVIALINDEKLKLMQPSSYYNLSNVLEAVRVAERTKGNLGKVILTS
ncbi:zinc-dependent alcohol dehydrogenase family protein [Bacillus sp. FJAT-50079]|uniref:zinc-dependent alcohol dehydrogenase family protein n=1 Tax=Bacillus sp. FJAT-50079 TaxID=2833577 RepID=UPI001BCA06C9|nr:zinc-dependent alcohol dehydrogenase family protein [Bacillus sp. FJAT-50079]MBS4209496.1 zinc-dependent alcohol dehydrogenase family protein [Bacillus sp. FJAT-50079]